MLFIKALFTTLLFLSLSFFAVSEDAIFYDDVGEQELIYFFSLHCESCYKVNASLSAFELSIAKSKKINIKKIPIIQKNWMFGARLYFLIEASRNKHSLTKYERELTGYSIVANTLIENYPSFDYQYARILRDNGMIFDALEFKAWWEFSKVMIDSSLEVMSAVGMNNIKPPSIRFHSEGYVRWVYLNVNDNKPENSLLSELIEVVK